MLNNSFKHQATLSFVSTSAMPDQNVLIAWPVVMQLAVFSRTAHPNNFTFITVLSWVLTKTPGLQTAEDLLRSIDIKNV